MRAFVCSALLVLGLWGGELRILAAANLKNVLEEIKQEFLKSYPDESIIITYLSSGKAYAQIKNGFEADLFFSADSKKPQMLFDEGMALLEPRVYALGKLVLCAMGNVNISTPYVLKSSEKIKHIAIANPKLAPYGEAGVEYLKRAKLYESVQDKLVYGDSIGQALNFVRSGNAEVGLNALSLVINDSKMSYLILDPALYSPIKQSFIILKKSKNQALSRAFSRFVLSNDGQGIFLKYGYERGQ